MSAKWIRAKKWDDAHLTGALLPVKWVLRTFSGIPLAVVLLSLVAFYGVLASVPIGLIALAPTWGFYALTAVAAVLVGAGLPVWLTARAMRRIGVGPVPRFVVSLLAMIGLAVVSAAAWYALAWPYLYYRPASIGGVESYGIRFFADFVEQYKSVQFRRLPIMEMSELEFYSWWPLRVVLLLFVVNMVTTTLRRIEFRFVNLGVLTVHTGIVTIALGSVVYGALKQEGDMLLQAGQPAHSHAGDAPARPGPGPIEHGFYDNTAVAIWAQQLPLPEGSPGGWEQWRLRGLPRYNDYNLAAGSAEGQAFEQPPGTRDLGPIDISARMPSSNPRLRVVADDVALRVVGYASYATLDARWVAPPSPPSASPPASVDPAAPRGSRLREVEAYLTLPESQGGSETRPQKIYRFLPDSPAGRVDILDVLGVEFTRGMDPRRWDELTTPLPRGTQHTLIVEHPASGFRSVYPVQAGQKIRVGDTGYRLEVLAFEPRPPFPIITRGYQGATSSAAIVRVEQAGGPVGDDGAAAAGFERWIYHRFPEISQDMLDERNERGMPIRRDADPALRITYLDASILQVYLDERVAGELAGTVRAIVRMPGGQASVTETLRQGDFLQVAPSLKLRLGARSDEAVQVEAPIATPEPQRDKADIGTHRRGAVAVEVGLRGDPAFKRIVWLPFTQYMGIDRGMERTVELPDGRRLALAFGRVWHELPFDLRLVDFEMIPYEHSDTPRDYRSEVLVMSRWGGLYQDRVRRTSLNEPLLVRVPYIPSDDVAAPVNALRRLWNLVIPKQYKFSQAGWDAEGWRQSKAALAAGQGGAAGGAGGGRPFARFTILGVGNNPGIYVIAAGAVMMSLGIPWAFYVKPAILRYRKRKIQRELAEKAGPQRSQSGHRGHKGAEEVHT